MTDIVIQGIYGRMGHALIEKIAARQDCRVVAGVDREAGKVGDIPVYAGFEGLPKVDAIIDFSSPAGAVAAVRCRQRSALRHLLHRPFRRGRDRAGGCQRQNAHLP